MTMDIGTIKKIPNIQEMVQQAVAMGVKPEDFANLAYTAGYRKGWNDACETCAASVDVDGNGCLENKDKP